MVEKKWLINLLDVWQISIFTFLLKKYPFHVFRLFLFCFISFLLRGAEGNVGAIKAIIGNFKLITAADNPREHVRANT